MARQVRIQYPGAMYHVMSRGNRRQDIFLDDVDRQDFLKTLAEACQKTGWQEADLAFGRKRDPRKVEVAMRLRKETTLSVKQIAERLHLGTPAGASVCLLAAMRDSTSGAPAQGQLGV